MGAGATSLKRVSAAQAAISEGSSKGLPWPTGFRILLYPGATLPDGLKLNAPVPCAESGVEYWQLGGPSKARLRVSEDDKSVLKLGEEFTVGIFCRAGSGETAGYDSLLLGHDNKHWLSFKGGDDSSLCCVEGESGKAFDVKTTVSVKGWGQYFLKSKPSGGTTVLGVDSEGLVDLGSFDTSLTGSKLRNCGWADNEVHLLAFAIWDRSIPWSELSAAVAPTSARAPQLPPPQGPSPTTFRGRVVDIKGEPVPDVRVSWSCGGCQSDKYGYFAGVIEDDEEADETETQVPEDGASQSSGGSNSSWISLSFACEGYAPMSSPANAGTDNSLRVTMRPVSASSIVDAAVGGSVMDEASGSSVKLPPNVLAYPDGSPVEGPVSVSLSVIDVTDPAGLASMPGDFSAIGADGADVMLQSLGAAWIGATDENGKHLQVREGSEGVTLDLHTEAKANAEKLGVTPEMWSFDESTGKWELLPSAMKLDGADVPNQARPAPAAAAQKATAKSGIKIGGKMGKMKRRKEEYKPGGELVEGCMSPEDFILKVAADGKKSISANIPKLGYINCDLAYHHPQRAVMLKGLVLDSKRQPVPSVQLWGTGRDYQGRTPDVSDSDGRFGAMIAQFDSEVDVEVQYSKETEDDQQIEVYFENRRRLKRLRTELPKETYDALATIPGQFVRKGSANGQPAWTKQGEDGLDARVSWNPSRRRWEASVPDRVIFHFAGGDEPGLPFGNGWVYAGSIANVPAPTFKRRIDIISQTFGPFKTGPPGEFVDVGELLTDA